MPDFSYLQKNKVDSNRGVDYAIVELEGPPVLVVRPATEANPSYFNEAARRQSRKGTRSALLGAPLTADVLNEARKIDRELYPKSVVIGWRGVLDRSGEPVDFSQGNCHEYLVALPDHIFDGIRAFCLDASNFTNTEEIDPGAFVGN